jgi:cytochrome P450
MFDRQLPVPSHVPEHLVREFDLYNAPELLREPHQSMLRWREQVPPIFYTPLNGGHWVVTRTQDAVDMLQRPDAFSSDPEFNVGARKPRTLPNLLDPPDHTEYRRILGPYFSPGAVNKMEPEIRAFSRELIDKVHASGHCEFVSDIAKLYSVTIFLRLVDTPQDDRDMLVSMAEIAMRDDDPAKREAAGNDLLDYVRGCFAKRRGKAGGDLLSHVMRSKFQGRDLTEDELMATGLLLFLAGLDTVVGVLSFIMLYLGRHPDQYQCLVKDPALIGRAMEELLRVNGVSCIERGVHGDTDYHGIAFKNADRILFLLALSGFDDEMGNDPLTVDLDREISRHWIFGAGPHRCLGSHLARLEMRVFLEEWVARIPRYRIAEPVDLTTRGGIVWQPVSLPLTWEISP